MTQQVWKYPLYTANKQTVWMPKGATLLTIQMQQDVPTLWALVDPNEIEQTPQIINTVGTGQDTDAPGKYIGTYQRAEGVLVFHVFAATE